MIWRTRFANAFARSVQAQMISDVPIGAFLSAGLDSSSIVAMMRRSDGSAGPHLHDHFSSEVPRRRDNAGRSRSGDATGRTLGCENQRIVVEPDVAELLPRLVWHMDEPTADPAIITAYLVCREARKAGHSLAFRSGRRRVIRRIPQACRALLGAGLRTSAWSRPPGDRSRACAAAGVSWQRDEGERPAGKENGAQRLT